MVVHKYEQVINFTLSFYQRLYIIHNYKYYSYNSHSQVYVTQVTICISNNALWTVSPILISQLLFFTSIILNSHIFNSLLVHNIIKDINAKTNL